MSDHERVLREYVLVGLMLSDRQALYAEFFRVVGDNGGSREPGWMLDRNIINAILDKEYPRHSDAGRPNKPR